jgi:hypothetical protein
LANNMFRCVPNTFSFHFLKSEYTKNKLSKEPNKFYI